MCFFTRFTLLPTSLILLGCLTLIHARLYAQPDSLPYSQLPHETIHLGQKANFSLFDEAFYTNQLFLLGESHGIQKPQELDFELLKHLNHKTGLRYYLAELDATKARYINVYLKTGNENLLDSVFRSWVQEQAQWANKNFLDKIRKIRALNQTLSSARQIEFVGIDRIQDKSLVAQELSQLLRNKQLPATTKPIADSLIFRLSNQTPDSLAAQWALKWLATWPQQQAAYEQQLGPQVSWLHQLLTNIGYLSTIRSRETILFTNFKALLPSLHQEKVYGLWGFFHVLQTPLLNGSKPLASLIKESNLSLRDKIVSISCSYLDCYAMTPTHFLPPTWQDKGKTYTRLDKFNNDSDLMHVEGIDAMRAATQANTSTLFVLNRPGSFAHTTPLRIRYSAYMPKSQQLQFDPHRAITDYFQYIILVRNSEMTQPIVP